MTRAEETLQLYKNLWKPTVLLLLWMSFLRALLFSGAFYVHTGWNPDLGAAFLAGIRFDILVLGFLWIPVWLLAWLSPGRSFLYGKFYFMAVALLVAGLSAADLFWSAAKGSRLNHDFFSDPLLQVFSEGWSHVGSGRSFLLLAIFFFSGFRIVRTISRMSESAAKKTSSRTQVTMELILSLFLVALAARGTWTPHHLNAEHAQVSANPWINQLPLNPLWNLDK